MGKRFWAESFIKKIGRAGGIKKSIIRKIEPGTSQFSQTLESINQSQSKIWNEFPKNEIGQLCLSFNSLLQTCINSN